MNTVPHLTALCCSPRAKGNSDTLARCFLDGFVHAGGSAQTQYLRNYQITPCTGCGHCIAPPHQCVLAPKDDVENIFASILSSSHILLSSPIFFYALPAHAKALIDRAQRFWNFQHKTPHHTQIYIALIAARQQGKELFTGSLLCLKYFFEALGCRIDDVRLLRGYDTADALQHDVATCQSLSEWGANVVACSK